MKLIIEKVKSSGSFTGILDGELPLALLNALHSDDQPVETLQVIGEYEVDWDDDIAQPYVTSIDVLFEGRYVDLEPFLAQDVNEMLDEWADSLYGDWAEDKAGRDIDYAYDSMQDR